MLISKKTPWLLSIIVLTASCAQSDVGVGEGESSSTAMEDSTSAEGDDESLGETSQGDDSSAEADSGDTSDTDSESDTGGTGGEGEGCEGALLLESDPDPSVRGAWQVGARTVMVDDFKVELWYPTTPDSIIDTEPKKYDIREQLPPSEMDTIPDEDNPFQDCDCYDQVAMDNEHGPYPLIVFIHGTAGFRTQSLTQMTHWASRGFVVAAADYEGLRLAHILALLCPDAGGNKDLSGDTDKVFAAITAATGELSFLAGRVDLTRVGLVGHSAGGDAAATGANKPGVRVVIPMGSTLKTDPSESLESTLFLGATEDGVVGYSGSTGSYEDNVAPKRLVGIQGAGHLAFSNMCELENAGGLNFVEIGQAYGICGTSAASFLFDCGPELLPEAQAHPIVNYATTAVLEEVLQCKTEGPDLADIGSVFSEIGEYREEL